jgi:DNA-binding FadR family transcriptional regulator
VSPLSEGKSTKLFDVLSELLLESRKKSDSNTRRAEVSLKEHKEIHFSIKSGNSKRAHQRMLAHMDNAKDVIRRVLSEGQAD